MTARAGAGRVRSGRAGPEGDALTASPGSLRRLAVVKQRLDGRASRRPSKAALLSVVRDLGYVQWDPVPIVAPSHLLSFWARLGNFRTSDLEALLWKDRKLLQHWIPFAAIVLAEDYPLYGSLMHRYPESLSRSWGRQRDAARRFLGAHADLRGRILRTLREGPLTTAQFEDHARTLRRDGDWSPGSDVAEMLYHLLMRGEVLVARHDGAENVWGLVEQFLPGWAASDVLSAEEADCAAAERSIRALGVATPREIRFHFVRGCYQDLPAALSRLSERSLIHRVVIDGSHGRQEEQYVHDRDVALLESKVSKFPEASISLLPPFDNLVCSQARLLRLFGFDYVREQFLPAEKRRFGTYVLPILWGDEFIGRIDPRLDRERGKLIVNSVHAESGAPKDRGVARALRDRISDLAEFLGASEVAYSSRVPEIWRAALH